MSKEVRPSVLIVDDEPDERSGLARTLEEEHLDVDVVHPNEVTPDLISEADLVLVDYLLERWPEREKLRPAALKPMNGIALTGVLRAHAELDKLHHSPAFVLHSGYLEQLSPDFPPEHRPHVLAQSYNLEWVLPKGNLEETIPQIRILAQAIRELPREWTHTDAEKTCSQLKILLDFNQEMPGSSLAWEDIERCHPPIHELSETSHGLSIIRWLLHRILPFPTFLWDALYLAARFRLDSASVKRAIVPIREALASVEYSGMLSDFLGVRWWRSGIEAWIWEVTDAQPHRPEKLLEVLKKRGIKGLEPVPTDHELVCLGHDYRFLEKLYRLKDAVRIQPDHWPPYADQAWSPIEVVRNDRALRALVMQDDQESLA